MLPHFIGGCSNTPMGPLYKTTQQWVSKLNGQPSSFTHGPLGQRQWNHPRCHCSRGVHWVHTGSLHSPVEVHGLTTSKTEEESEGLRVEESSQGLTLKISSAISVQRISIQTQAHLNLSCQMEPEECTHIDLPSICSWLSERDGRSCDQSLMEWTLKILF
ncbi:uncharacterized protein sb:cb288 isoform X1 [Esox lucius]|uniref:uncharacterized protein sb:cb288 isoform X1 n=1 Tax=Esox lucius TaxID=8010 RepID=UPI001477750A|nr:uncharacterized protein sb:cb288 isoform X1 [Esox lucius]XP_034152593.1 uncharacterized protein sb:cb288 isoform X1 [Esox lucius]XP_034152594.1 uncharacterized protein sb:cb288 isoform X1 [Esox lucius]